MFDYFVNTRGVNNLVWLIPFSGDPSSSVYPGDEYVDIAGADTYDRSQPFGCMFDTMLGIVGDTMPIAPHETGQIPNPDDMFNGSAAPWVLFSVWAEYGINENSVSDIQATYSNSRAITRDEVPDLR